jgi:hypothetical protein
MSRYDPNWPPRRPLNYQAPQDNERKSVLRVIGTVLLIIVLALVALVGLLFGACYLMMHK